MLKDDRDLRDLFRDALYLLRLTHRQAAELLYVSRHTVAEWVRRDRAGPPPMAVELLYAKLGLELPDDWRSRRHGRRKMG